MKSKNVNFTPLKINFSQTVQAPDTRQRKFTYVDNIDMVKNHKKNHEEDKNEGNDSYATFI